MSIFKCPVIASHVASLTDARYFAARGVDFLLYDLSLLSIAEISEIQEWVSGPKVLLLFSDASVDIVDEAMIRIQPYGIGTLGQQSAIDHLMGHVQIIQWQADVIALEDRRYISYDAYVRSPADGVFVRGGVEASVGIKSFEELDDIFDALEC